MRGNKVEFDVLIARLSIYIRTRINSGEFTERSLARALRISQPHLHNMLKGARRISLEFANRAMSKFDITVLDLISDEEVWSHLDHKNPDWVASALIRKPPAQANQRTQNHANTWRTPKAGS